MSDQLRHVGCVGTTLLLARRQILDRHFIASGLVVAHDRHETNASRVRIFELLANLVSVRIDVDPQTRRRAALPLVLSHPPRHRDSTS